jgi:glycosyltransferase involved in cell wall biosynthesis
MIKLTATIITFNEEDNIDRCLKSLVEVADEIVIVDSNSTDKTQELCEKYGAKFYSHDFLGYKEQKSYAVEKASNDYIISLDADEALSEEMKNSILQAKGNWNHDGYSFNRLNNYCGQWIFHSNWYPDRKVRLFDRRKGYWGGVNPHDKFLMDKSASTKHLKGDLLHWVIDSYEDHIQRANNFSSIAALEYFKMGKSTSPFTMSMRLMWHFFKAYVLRGGFRDGYNGFVISSVSAYESFLKYLKLRQLNLDADRVKLHTKATRKINIAGNTPVIK